MGPTPSPQLRFDNTCNYLCIYCDRKCAQCFDYILSYFIF